jgi:RNA polymerase sigma-B factor
VITERQREERAAFARLQEDAPGAREALVERYLPLVRHLARRYSRASEPLEDLVQVGSIGLLNAIDRYDPASGSAFSSYAVPTILGEIRRHFRDRTWSVRVPRSLKDLVAESRDGAADFERRVGRMPTAAELAKELDTDVERLLEARLASAAQYPDSLDRPIGGVDGDVVPLQEHVGQYDPALDQAEDAVSMAMLTSCLSERDQELLRLRFEEDLTQSDIADRVGLSQMHVSRLLRGALDQLATRLEGPGVLKPANGEPAGSPADAPSGALGRSVPAGPRAPA